MLEIESQTNELLAKLLAAENIYVRFDSQIGGLAAFDLKSRVLHISTLNDEMQKYLPALLVHEVGHALYTNLPEDTPPEFLFNNCNFLKNVWNAIEDGYVDRKTGKKYPGIKQNRTELFDEIFSEMDKPEPRALHLLNLLTANCKGFPIGKFFEWPEYVSDEHRELFQQAIFINEPELMARISFSALVKDAIASYGDSDSNSPDGDVMFGEGGEGNEDSSTSESSSNQNKLSDQQLDDLLENNKSNVLNDDNIKEKFKNSEKASSEKLQGGVWDEIDIGSIRIPSQKDINDLSEIYDIFQFKMSDSSVYTDYGYPKFLDMHPAFTEMKKNFNIVNKAAKLTSQKLFSGFIKQVHAKNYALTSFRKSGTLDATRASLFQIQDDIFKNRNIQPNQQNHAYVVMLDWSGSMQRSLGALVHRALELTHFANFAGIELEIWLYTDTDGRQSKFNRTLANMSPSEQQRYSGLLFRQPKFIKVLNTKKHKNELSNRLLNLFISSQLAVSKIFRISNLQQKTYLEKNIINHCWRAIVDEDYNYENIFNAIGAGGPRNKLKQEFKTVKKAISQEYELLSLLQRENMYRNIATLTQMSGTTIFEAISFAGQQLENIDAEVKNIILLSDGSDSQFGGVIGTFSLFYPTKSDKNFFGITPSLPKNLLKQVFDGHKNLTYDVRQVPLSAVNTHLGNLKHLAITLIIEKLRKQQISVNMIGWNLESHDEKNFEKVFGKRPLNIESEASKSHVKRYVQMDNPFITQITKSLLGH